MTKYPGFLLSASAKGEKRRPSRKGRHTAPYNVQVAFELGSEGRLNRQARDLGFRRGSLQGRCGRLSGGEFKRVLQEICWIPEIDKEIRVVGDGGRKCLEHVGLVATFEGEGFRLQNLLHGKWGFWNLYEQRKRKKDGTRG